VSSGCWSNRTHGPNGIVWRDGPNGTRVRRNECRELSPSGAPDTPGASDTPDARGASDAPSTHGASDAPGADLRAPYIHRLRQYAIVRLHEFVHRHTDDKRSAGG
jgi:hypothetical protein